MSEKSKGKHSDIFKFLILIAILAGCVALGRYYHFDVDECRQYLAQFPVAFSGLIFISFYAVVTTLIWFGPKDIFRITGAIFFGGIVSGAFVIIAEMINAIILFHLSRKLGRAYVEKRFKIKTRNIDGVRKGASALSVFALRLNPLVPFRVLDLSYGLTGISFNKYFLASFIATIPRVLWLQVILAGIGESLFKDYTAMITYLVDNPDVIIYSTIYFLAVLVVSVVALVAKIVNRTHKADDPFAVDYSKRY